MPAKSFFVLFLSPNKLLLKPSQTQVAWLHIHPPLTHEAKVKLTPMRETRKSLKLMLTSNKLVGVRRRLNLQYSMMTTTLLQKPNTPMVPMVKARSLYVPTVKMKCSALLSVLVSLTGFIARRKTSSPASWLPRSESARAGHLRTNPPRAPRHAHSNQAETPETGSMYHCQTAHAGHLYFPFVLSK